MAYNDVYEMLRTSAQESLDKKGKKGKIRAVLGYSICSVSAGANEVLRALQTSLIEAELNNVIIETTGCMGLCSKEPLLDIYTSTGDRYTYEMVTPKKAKAILISHSMYDEDIEEWLLKM